MSDVETYSIVLEHFEDRVFIHIDVLKWNVSIFKQVCTDLMYIQEKYPVLYSYNPHEQSVKFAEMFNFVVTDEEAQLEDGTTCPIMRRG